MTTALHTRLRFALASTLARCAFRVCPPKFFNRFCEESQDLAEFMGYEQPEQGHWTADGTQRVW